MFDKRLFRLALSAKNSLWLTVGLGLLGGVLIVAQAALLSLSIDQAFLQGANLAQTGSWLWLLAGVMALRGLAAGLTELSAENLAARVKRQLRTDLLAAVERIGPLKLRGERSGELTTALIEGVEALDAYYREYLPQLMLAAMIPLLMLVVILPFDLATWLIWFLTAPLIPFFMFLIGAMADRLTKQQWLSLTRMSAYFLDVLQGLPTLKLLGRSRAQIAVIEQISHNFSQATLKVLRVAFLSSLALELVSTLSVALVAVSIGVRMLSGSMDFLTAFFLLVLAPDFYLPLRLLGVRFHAGVAGKTAAQRIFALLDQAAAEPAVQGGQSWQMQQPPSLHLEGVRYTYTGEHKPALDGIDLDIPAGAHVALVGPSGAGKSTLAALLLGFARPQDGRILVDGQDLASLNPAGWRSGVAWVPQRPHLINASVWENIALGEAAPDRGRVEEAARQALADDFIRQLPQGYDTQIGEQGLRLSGGQAQRLALARAFYKDAPLVILDEATANLDPALEAELNLATRRLLAGRTALLIAHRLSTVQHATAIVVLQGGQIHEMGTHAALLRSGGLYRQLVEAYAAGSAFDGLEGVETSPGSSILEADQRHPVEAAQPAATSLHPLRLLVSFLRPYRLGILASIGMGFATVGAGIGLMMSSAYIISRAALRPTIDAIQIAIVGVRFFGISRGVFRYLERYLSHTVTFSLLGRLRGWFYQTLEPLAPARWLSFHSGDLLNRITADISALENFYVRAVAPPVVAILTALMMTFVIGAYDARLGLILLSGLILGGAGLPWLIARLSRAAGMRLVRARSVLRSGLIDSVQGLSDALIFDPQGRLVERRLREAEDLLTAQAYMARYNALQSGLGILISNLTMLSILAGAIVLAANGQIDGVLLATIALGALASFEAVQPLPAAAAHWSSSLEAARRLAEIVAVEPAVDEHPADALPLPAEMSIQARNLTFTYPGSSRPALRGVSFSILAGQRVAIVGPSGAGKSTLVQLLARFWQAPDGSLLIGDVPLERLTAEPLRRSMAVVSQRVHLFNATLLDNLRLARPSASREEIIVAAKAAQIHDWIAAQPQGYDTWIGEQGLRLSGGERQRIAIARALLQDARLVIFDEATANLDALTERSLGDALNALRTGHSPSGARTWLVITHRLNDLERMDQILVLKDGQLVENGSHAGLLAQRGLYWQLFNQQGQGLQRTA